MGLSQRDLKDYSLEAQVADLASLIEHLGLEDFALFGSSQGGVIALAYAAKHPEVVSHLILYGTYHSIPWEVREKMSAVLPLIEADWTGLGTAPMIEMFVPGATTETREFFARYQKEAANGADAAAIMGALASYEVTSLLPEITVPTLIIHRRDDTAVDVVQSREIAAAIPNARLVVVEGKVHLPYWGETGPLLDTIRDFLGEDRILLHERSTFRTILFTDVEGSTSLTDRLGDAKARELLREHERITREALRAHGGSEVKTMGDGFMASFSSVTKAVECAIALQRAFAKRESDEPLSVRVGLNAGEPIEEDGDLFGATVILASRIAAKAEGGEILVADTIRGLCSGKGFLFADRGEFVAKGFEEPVRLYEVRWSESG
jgi:class 3 adenylate cyclase